MKYAKYLLLSSLLLGLTFVASCKNKATDRPLVVGVLIGPEYAEQSEIVLQAVRKAAESDGRGVIVSEQVGEANDAAYHSSFEKLRTARADEEQVMGLLLTGNPKIDIKEDIRGASLTGRPIVVFGQDFPESHRDIFVATDDGLAGKMLGSEVCQAPAPGRKIIAVVTGQADNEKQSRLMTGLQNELKQYAQISILKTITYENDAQTTAELKSLLNQTPNLFAIVSTGPWIFHAGAAEVLSDYKGRIYAFGNTPDAFAALKAGRANSLVVEDMYQQAFLAARYCFMRLRTITVSQPVPLKPVLVTQETLPEVMSKWGLQPLRTEEENTNNSQERTGEK
jgi:ABC-type sugar transport system substrate-binding protein